QAGDGAGGVAVPPQSNRSLRGWAHRKAPRRVVVPEAAVEVGGWGRDQRFRCDRKRHSSGCFPRLFLASKEPKIPRSLTLHVCTGFGALLHANFFRTTCQRRLMTQADWEYQSLNRLLWTADRDRVA